MVLPFIIESMGVACFIFSTSEATDPTAVKYSFSGSRILSFSSRASNSASLIRGESEL